jgi:hypothetical protein
VFVVVDVVIVDDDDDDFYFQFNFQIAWMNDWPILVV